MKSWRKYLHLAAAAALALAVSMMTSIGYAQTTAHDHDINRTELTNFDRYLDRNPQVANDLKQNPSLINNAGYLQGHPGLQQFLSQHPGVAEEARENPNQLVHRENRFDNSGRDLSRRQDAGLDQFLDNHKDVARDLRKNPSLANDPNFLAKHPGFQQYLSSHPGVQKEIQENPRAVLRAQRRYENHEDKAPANGYPRHRE